MEQKKAVFYFENKNDMSEKEVFGCKKDEGQRNLEDVNGWAMQTGEA
jgi:hypothetical protein